MNPAKPFSFPKTVEYRPHVPLSQKITIQFLRLVQLDLNRTLSDICQAVHDTNDKDLVNLTYAVPTKVLEDEVPLVKENLLRETKELIRIYGPKMLASEFSVLHAYEMVLTCC